jgi:hypothetical protein
MRNIKEEVDSLSKLEKFIAEGVGYIDQEFLNQITEKVQQLLDEREREIYEQALDDLHNNDKYQLAIQRFGEWNSRELNKTFEEVKAELLSNLSKQGKS